MCLTVSGLLAANPKQRGREKAMYMINYKNTYQRKLPLVRRVTAFLNRLVGGSK